MHHFQYKGNELCAEDVAVKDIVATVGSPVYIYSQATLERHYRAFDDAFAGVPHTICYSVKANSTLAVLRNFIKLGGGVDIVSGGELFRSLKAGVDPKKVVYSGVGKRDDEIEYAHAGVTVILSQKTVNLISFWEKKDHAATRFPELGLDAFVDEIRSCVNVVKGEFLAISLFAHTTCHHL